MKNEIKAIIFDMDGVLVNAKEWHFRALNNALNLFGLGISRKAHLRDFDGLPTKTKLNLLSRQNALPTALHSFINEMKQIYTLDIINAHCHPNKTRQNALKRLKDKGYKLALCSNAVRKSVQVMIEKSALSQYLDFCLSNEDVSSPKPNAEIYQKAIKRLNLSPKEVLILEDNINGIKAARASGAWVMEIERISQVNYKAIECKIREIELKMGAVFA